MSAVRGQVVGGPNVDRAPGGVAALPRPRSPRDSTPWPAGYVPGGRRPVGVGGCDGLCWEVEAGGGDAAFVRGPAVARVWDALLGGSHNFGVDRRLAVEATRVMPQLPAVVRAVRRFRHRAVRMLAQAGVRQFLDLGCGLPTAGAVHEVAGLVDPAVRVVYVDLDPVVIAYAAARVADGRRAGAVRADVADPDRVLSDPVTRRLIDPGLPVGLVMVDILPFLVTVEDPAALVAAYRDAVAAGSWVMLSHTTADPVVPAWAAVAGLLARTPTPMIGRPRARVADLVAGFDLVDPGVVRVPAWRPEPGEEPDDGAAAAGVAGDAAVGRTARARPELSRG